SAAAGSKKNVYLATCTTRGSGCAIPILCSLFSTSAETSADSGVDAAAETSSTVIYYNGPANPRSSPNDIGTVSSPARSWEGATRRTSLDVGDFEGKIARDADDLAKSQIAGSAKLDSEEFVCFRDGESTFQFREGLLGFRSVNCLADYWCASIEI
ncbi:hypothetical protein BKA66DRAFT_385194, partial [Pyrenochaeta sp. MPI-SDFR-AT-0127]